MPATVQHVFSNTVANGTNTNIVRPADWNSVHNFTLNAQGSEISGAFSNANGLSFGLSGGQVTGSYTVPNVPAQTAFVFSNSNGVTFGTDGSTVTASVQTNYQAPGAYLTTAAQSNHSHNFATTTTAGSNIVVGTANSVGATIGVPAFLTTAQSVGAYLTTARASNDAIGLNSGLTANGVSMTANSSGLSLNFPAFLTTAALSNHSHGNPTLALTNLSGTTASASNGFTLSLSAAVGGGAGDGYNILAVNGNATALSTTQTLSNSNNVSFGLAAGVITASASFAQSVQTQNLVSVQGSTGAISFANSNGITFGGNASTITASHNGLTTAAQSNHSHNFATTTTAGALIVVGTANSVGATIGVPAFLTTAQPAGAYLTTARASTDAIGLNSGLTANGVSMTANSSGLSLNFPAFLTTAALSNHSHGNPTLALTNLSGTTASNSAGLTLSLSAAAPGGGVSPVASASNGSFSFTTLGFSNANNVTFGTSAGSIITASVAAPGAAAENNWIHMLGANTSGNTTASGTTIGMSGINLTLSGTNGSQMVISAPAVSSLVGVGGISLSTNGSTISISHTGVPAVPQYWACPPWVGGNNALITNITAIDRRPFFMPFKVQGTLSAQELMWNMSRSTSGSNAFTVDMGIYRYSNSSVISLLTSAQNVYSQTDTASISGIRQFEINFASFSLTPGDYVLGMLFSANGGATASMNYSLIGATTANMPVGNVISGSNAYHTYTSHQAIQLEGRYTNTSAALPGTVSQAGVIGAFTGASMILRPNWTLATHN